MGLPAHVTVLRVAGGGGRQCRGVAGGGGVGVGVGVAHVWCWGRGLEGEGPHVAQVEEVGL